MTMKTANTASNSMREKYDSQGRFLQFLDKSVVIVLMMNLYNIVKCKLIQNVNFA